jgi:hypothetical protein
MRKKIERGTGLLPLAFLLAARQQTAKRAQIFGAIPRASKF